MRKRDLTVVPKVLTKQQVENYGREGFISPVRVPSATAAAECRRELEAMEASMGGALRGPIRENRRRGDPPRAVNVADQAFIVSSNPMSNFSSSLIALSVASIAA